MAIQFYRELIQDKDISAHPQQYTTINCQFVIYDSLIARTTVIT